MAVQPSGLKPNFLLTAKQRPEKRLPVSVDGSRILVVDDNEVNRTILSEQMAAWRFDFAAASSGEEAIAVLKAAAAQGVSVDCVVLDYHMPGMNGGDVVKAIRRDSQISTTPVVMLTSVDQTEDGKMFSSLGIQGHLTKPARSSLLLETLIDVLCDLRGEAIDDDEISRGIMIAQQVGKSGRKLDAKDDAVTDEALPIVAISWKLLRMSAKFLKKEPRKMHRHTGL